MECFIYAITNTVTGRRYIGSCVKVKRRFGEHRSFLKCNNHHCAYLQNSYNKHGKENFTFSIVRALTTNDRKTRDIAELEEIAKAPCFNSLLAQTNLQFFTSSDETKLKISESGKKRYQDRPEIAEKHSAFMKVQMSCPIARAKLSESVKAAHTEDVCRKKSESAKKSWASGKRKPRPIRILPPEEIQSKSERMKTYWATPEALPAKDRQKAAVQAYWTPEAREEKARKQKEYRHSDETKEKMAKSGKKAWTNPTEAMKGIAAKSAASWTDPEARKLRSEKMKASWADPEIRKLRHEKAKAAWIVRRQKGTKPCKRPMPSQVPAAAQTAFAFAPDE